MFNLQTLPIELPAGLTAVGEQSLPFALENELVAFCFDADPELGARLSWFGPKDEARPFRFVTRARGRATAVVPDQALWEIQYGLVEDTATKDEQTQRRFTPRDAGDLQAWRVHSTADESGILLAWSGIRISASGSGRRESVFFVAQLVMLPDDDPCTRWLTWVGRESGESVSIEAVESPSIHVRGPVAPRKGESHLDAQRRSRLLIPVVGNFIAPIEITQLLLLGVNRPLYHWSVSSVKHVLPHPNRQQQQFAGVYAADSTDEPSFRRFAYLATEDAEGYFKEFHHEGYQLDGKSGPEGWYNWRARYVPGYEDALSDAEETPRTRFGNTYVTPYAAVVGPMVARTDEFWFDVTAYYRDWVGQSGMWRHRLVDDPERGLMAHYVPVVGWLERRGGFGGETLWDDFRQALRTIRKGLDPHGERTPLILAHSQSTRKDGRGVTNPDSPLEETVDPLTRVLMRELWREGVSTSLYVNPSGLGFEMSPNFAAALPREARRYGPDAAIAPGTIFLPGAAGTEETAKGYELDYASPAAHTWFLENLYGPLMTDFGMRGAYMDVLAGDGVRLAYDPPPPIQATHVAHGGKQYVAGKLVLIDAVRKFTKELAARNNEDPRRYFLAGEGIEEFIGDRFEWANAGYNYFANHLMFGEDTVLRWLAEYTGQPDPKGAFDGVPAISRNMSPPLWNMVHHEWAPGQRLPIPWNNVGLATNRRVYPKEHHFPNTPDYAGMPHDRFVDLYCFTAAMHLTEGVNPVQFTYYRHIDERLRDVRSGFWTLDDAGNPGIETQLDPGGAGLELRRFFARLHRAMTAGPLREFVLYGRMERSLDVDYGLGDIALWTNPFFWVFGQRSASEFPDLLPRGRHVDPGEEFDPDAGVTTDLLAVSPYPMQTFLEVFLSGFLDYQVPQVLHSVWRKPSSEIGVLLVNWTREPADVSLPLDADRLGLDEHHGVMMRAYSFDSPVGSWERGTGSSIVISTSSPRADWRIPAIAPRSVMVLRVVDTRLPIQVYGS